MYVAVEKYLNFKILSLNTFLMTSLVNISRALMQFVKVQSLINVMNF